MMYREGFMELGIIGLGSIGGQQHAFLLTLTPEPSASALLVGGLGLLGTVVRRRRA